MMSGRPVGGRLSWEDIENLMLSVVQLGHTRRLLPGRPQSQQANPVQILLTSSRAIQFDRAQIQPINSLARTSYAAIRHRIQRGSHQTKVPTNTFGACYPLVLATHSSGQLRNFCGHLINTKVLHDTFVPLFTARRSGVITLSSCSHPDRSLFRNSGRKQSRTQ